MSTNCILCVVRDRTRTDLLCDRCRNIERIKDLRPPKPAGSADLDFLLEEIDQLEQAMAFLKADMGKGLHRRKCLGCQTVHWHVDNKTPWVCCPSCGSQDTRIVKER